MPIQPLFGTHSDKVGRKVNMILYSGIGMLMTREINRSEDWGGRDRTPHSRLKKRHWKSLENFTASALFPAPETFRRSWQSGWLSGAVVPHRAVCFAPRPDLADLDRKVRFGATKEKTATPHLHTLPRAV
jgi:hypothetical protein